MRISNNPTLQTMEKAKKYYTLRKNSSKTWPQLAIHTGHSERYVRALIEWYEDRIGRKAKPRKGTYETK